MFLRTVETAWARFVARKDARSLAIVFDRTAPELLRVARHLSAPGAEAEDLVQATFVVAMQAPEQHEAGRPVLPWLLGILANQARQARRQARRAIDPHRIATERLRDVHAEVDAGELRAELAAGIARLPEAARPVMRMWFELGLDANEIARTLERPAGTVRAQISRSLDQLRRLLPHGLAGSAAIAVVAGRGLAAVRAQLLAQCTGTSTTLLSTLSLGVLLLMHHKLASVGAAAALVLACWFWPAAPAPVDAAPVAVTGASATPATAEREAAAVDRSAAAAPAEPAARSRLDPAPAAPDVPSPATTGSAVVRVVAAEDGGPLADVGVALRRLDRMQDFGSAAVFVRTDGRGEIRFDALEPATWNIEVDRTGMMAAVDVVAGRVVERVVELPAGVTVDGVVVDAAGTPMPGAQLFVHGSRIGAERVATCDAVGRFRVGRLVAGVELQARASGHAPSKAVRVDGNPGAKTRLELRLGGAARMLTGVVIDAGGQPQAGAAVAVLPEAARTITPWDRAPEQIRALWLRTDGEGRFRTDEVAIGRHVVFARPADAAKAPAWAEVDTSGGDAWVELRSGLVAAITGVVRRDGVPVAGATVMAWPEIDSARLGYLMNLFGQRLAGTDATGAFRVDGVMPGPVTLRCVIGTELLGGESRTLAGGEVVEWDLSFGSGAPLTVRIASASALSAAASPGAVLPAGRTVAMVADPTIGGSPSMATFDAAGAAECRRRGNGPVDVTIAVIPGGQDFMMLARRSAVPATLAEVVFELSAAELPSAAVRGRLVDALGAPVPAVVLVARRIDGGELVVTRSATTGSDGAFAIGPLPAGRYAIGERDGAAVNGVLGEALLTTGRDEDVGDLRRQNR